MTDKAHVLQYRVTAPAGDFVECELRLALNIAENDAERAEIAALGVGQLYSIIDEDGTYIVERIA